MLNKSLTTTPSIADAVKFANKQLAGEHSVMALRNFSANWERYANKHNSSELLSLARKAAQTANYIDYDGHLPPALDDSPLENHIREIAIKALAVEGVLRGRTTQMFKRHGYVETVIKLVENNVGGGHFETLTDAGHIELTAEYLVYMYLSDRISAELLEKIQLLLIENNVEAY